MYIKVSSVIVKHEIILLKKSSTRLQSAVFNPILDNNSDIYIKKGDIEELYKGKYKDFKVQVYLQTYEVGKVLNLKMWKLMKL